MVEWIKNNTGYNKILVTLFIGLLSFIAVSVYNKVDLMPDKFVRLERYTSDQTRIEKTLEKIDGKIDRLIERHAK